MAGEVGLYEDEWSARIYDYQVRDTSSARLWLALAQEAKGPALEVACGTGRVLLVLARAGVRITGLDLSPHMLAVAREKLAREAPEVRERVRLEEGSMADFSLGEEFGLVCIPARSFQILPTREEQRQCLECCGRHLRPEGRLAIDVFHTSAARLAAGKVEEEVDAFAGPDGVEIRQSAHTEYDLANQTLVSLWRYEHADAGGGRVAHDYRLRLHYFFRFEFEWMLEACGFEVEALYGDFERNPFTAASPEMIFVARRRR